jgi:hypothetical protein
VVKTPQRGAYPKTPESNPASAKHTVLAWLNEGASVASRVVAALRQKMAAATAMSRAAQLAKLPRSARWAGRAWRAQDENRVALALASLDCEPTVPLEVMRLAERVSMDWK